MGATPDGSLRDAAGLPLRSASGSSTPASRATHPDIAPNFNRALSRNFTTDDPVVHGACAPIPTLHRPRLPSTRTATAPTWRGPSASPINGIGMGGSRAGLRPRQPARRSGLGLLLPPGTSVDALTYAGDPDSTSSTCPMTSIRGSTTRSYNPADSGGGAGSSSGTGRGGRSALDYALRSRRHARLPPLGNEHTDIGRPSSLDAPAPTRGGHGARSATVDKLLPQTALRRGEGRAGQSTRSAHRASKAYYSNYGVEQTTRGGAGGPEPPGVLRQLEVQRACETARGILGSPGAARSGQKAEGVIDADKRAT